MDIREMLEILHLAERLKDTLRHSWTSQGRRESVAEHSWRLSLMACLIRDEFPEADWEKVLTMAVLHDMGECFTGDIPAFWKTDADRAAEDRALEAWCGKLSQPLGGKLAVLFRELEAQETIESRIVKALDKLEVLIQHNEADISTWIDVEYERNLVHADKYVAFSGFMRALRDEVRSDTCEKIAQAGKNNEV